MASVNAVTGKRVVTVVVAAAVLAACAGARSAADDLAKMADDAVRGGDDLSRYLDDAAHDGRGTTEQIARQGLDDVHAAIGRYESVPPEIRAGTCAVVTDWWRAEVSGDPDAAVQAVQVVQSTVSALNTHVGSQGLANDLNAELAKVLNGEENTLDLLLLNIAVCEAVG